MEDSTTPINIRLEGYRRLIDITRDLASTLDLNILLERIVNAAAFIANAEAASILLYDSTSQQLHFQVATNMDQPTMRGLTVPLAGSIAGWIVTNRKIVRTADVHKDPRHFGEIGQATSFPTKSLLGVPLITKEKVIGVLEVINKKGKEFSDTDEDLLCVLGAQAAVAIENARLFLQSDLISELIHELRTPLAALSTATYLLLRPELSQTQHDQIVNNIHNETLRLNSLASSFLDLARLESGRVRFRPSEFNVVELLNECIDIMKSKAEQEKITISKSGPEQEFLLEADRDKIKQVILNLLSNAIKYNRPNGSIEISLKSANSDLVMFFKDCGIGIPEDALPHMFEKFYRVRDSEGVATGTGLGLSICKQIVIGHGGSIDVESQVGKGTTFQVSLPRKARKQ
ncbi:MAG: GAF domain-containing sensor histidine kinase [Anaerolineales bacterium]|nr:GAF domain-containing sensor histidine kinase [Anaerolineales bacterium]